MQKRYVVANFKMNKTDEEIEKYLSTLSPLVTDLKNVQVGLALPSVSIKGNTQKASENGIIIAGQNINENDFGAFTGEINAEMLAGVGAKAVIVGHSERRNLFKETDEIVNKKILKALKSGLTCVFCVGETLFDRKNGLTKDVLVQQITKGLNSIYANELKSIVIAYEPVWAIGTGITASANEVIEAIKEIRNVLTEMYDEKIAQTVSILYGGSVNDANCKDFAKLEGVNGALVGGASLVPERFIKIIKAFDVKQKNSK